MITTSAKMPMAMAAGMTTIAPMPKAPADDEADDEVDQQRDLEVQRLDRVPADEGGVVALDQHDDQRRDEAQREPGGDERADVRGERPVAFLGEGGPP